MRRNSGRERPQGITPKLTWGEWFTFVVDDDNDAAEWYRKIGGDLQFPPWLIAATITVPQMHGLWRGVKTDGLSQAQLIETANRIRQEKGLGPLKKGLPSCCKPPPPGWERKKKATTKRRRRN